MSIISKYDINQEDKFKIATLNFLNNPEDFNKRVELLTHELKTLNPQVISFQEIMEDCRKELKEALGTIGYKYFIYGDTRIVASTGVKSGNAIFSKLPFEDTFEFSLKPNSLKTDCTDLPIVVIKVLHKGQEIHILSSHFAFGPTSEFIRLQQALNVTRYAENIHKDNPKALIVLTGDLNATPDADSMRFLRGKHIFNETSTLWADSFKFVGKKKDWVTSPTDTYWAIDTAKSKGVPILVGAAGVDRRIDYIYVYGWVYGRNGSPLSYKTWGHKLEGSPYPLSDHYGIIVEILLPEA